MRSDALQAFGAESPDSDDAVSDVAVSPLASGEPARSSGTGAVWQTSAALVIASVAIVGIFAGANRWLRTPAPTDGTLTVTTEPPGVTVLIDLKRAGTTPLTLSVPAGAHTVVLDRNGDRKTVPVSITAGAVVSQHFEWAETPAPSAVGRLVVTSEPGGGRVLVDGTSRGIAPVTIDGLAAGEHTVSVTADGTTTDRKVTIVAGETTSLIFSPSKAAGPAAGWLTLASPFELEVFEGNDLLATSGAKIMLPAGRHDLRLVNEKLGYQDRRRVEVTAGKVAALKIDAPTATVSANARPWADLVIDGKSVGQTPLANLAIPIGTHEAVFRHPQLGEQRQTIVVTLNGPNRVSADLNHK